MMGSIARIAIGIALACSVTLGSSTASAADSAHKYVGANKCKTCHKKLGDQYAVWKKSSHAKAYEALLSDKAVAIAKEKGIAGPPSKGPLHHCGSGSDETGKDRRRSSSGYGATHSADSEGR